MGSSASKVHSPPQAASSRDYTISRIEAELVNKAYNKAWFGSSPKRVRDIPVASTPLYDSDDEPMEPSGVVNALAVSAPPLSSRHCAAGPRRSRSPSVDLTPLQPQATAAAAVVSSSASAATFYPAAPPASRRSDSSTSSSGSGGSNRRSTSTSSRESRRTSSRKGADQAAATAAMHPPGSRRVRNHLTAGFGNGATIIMPLSSALVAPTVGGRVKFEQLSLVSNRGSAADPNLRPYHHLHQMQLRLAQQRQQHQLQQKQQAVVTCGQVQVVQGVRGWHMTRAGDMVAKVVA